MLGAIRLWVANPQTGRAHWVMKEVHPKASIQAAIETSKSQRHVVVWYANSNPTIMVYFLNGEELLPTQVLELHVLNYEIAALHWPLEGLEALAAQALLPPLIAKRDELLLRLRRES